MTKDKDKKQTNHSHPVLRNRTALPPKKVPPRLIVPVEEPSVTPRPKVKRTGCCG